MIRFLRLMILQTLVAWSLTASAPAALLCFESRDGSELRDKWAFEAGVAFITQSSIEELLLLSDAALARGRAGGEIYSVSAVRRLGWLHIGPFRPEVELPLTLEIVDENGRSPFVDLNAAFALRWTEFPWNDFVRTTLATGVGFTWSEEVYQVDIDRHPDRDRSRWKFHWPIQVTFALPNHPEHQLKLFLTHQSGGHVFDEGGVNSVGIGYRLAF